MAARAVVGKPDKNVFIRRAEPKGYLRSIVSSINPVAFAKRVFDRVRNDFIGDQAAGGRCVRVDLDGFALRLEPDGPVAGLQGIEEVAADFRQVFIETDKMEVVALVELFMDQSHGEDPAVDL